MQKYIPVDFNNCDEDGAIRLTTRGVLAYREKEGLDFKDGDIIVVSDDEMIAEGVLEFRSGMWVLKVENWIDPD